MSQSYTGSYYNSVSGRSRPAPSPDLAQLIAEKIPVEKLRDAAQEALPAAQQEIYDANLARARLQSFISSCREDEEPSVKTVQEEGVYNIELREWTARLLELRNEVAALEEDIDYLRNYHLGPYVRPPAVSPATAPYVQATQPVSSYSLYPTPNMSTASTSYAMRPLYATPSNYVTQFPYTSHRAAIEQPVPSMEGWPKGVDCDGNCTRIRSVGRYRIVFLAPNDTPWRGLNRGRWTPEMGYQCLRREAEAEAKSAVRRDW